MDDNIIGRDGAFSEQERRVVAAIAGATVPEFPEARLPSADDPAILAVILRKAGHFEQRIRSGIETLLQLADPVELTPEELLSLLDRDSRLGSFSRVLTIVIMQAYYQDARVLAAWGLAPRPPFPQGHEVEQGDWSLLEPVKQRNAFYREV